MSLKYSLLGLLNYDSMTGYDLKNIFEKSINHFWNASASQIYRDLAELERQGYVTSHIEPQEGRPDKKVYTITEMGKGTFREWLDQFPSVLSPSVRMDFLVRIFFGAQIPPEDLKFQFQRFIKENEADLKELENCEDKFVKFCKDSSKEDPFFWGLTSKMGYLITKASITWAEECIKAIDEFTKKKSQTS